MSGKSIVAVAALILLFMAILAGGAALRESVTVDEVAHLGAGVSYLQKLDMRMNVEHPPLAKLLAGLPLAIRGARADYQNPAWTFGREGLFPAFLAQWSFGHLLLTRWNDPAVTLAWARLPMLLIMIALGALIYLCGSRLGGPWGGLLAVALYASMPAFLAFGPLVLTDIPITFFVLLTMWTFAALWESRGENRDVWPFALALAGALLTKFSAGILLFAFLAFRLSLRVRPLDTFPSGRDEGRAWRRRQWRATLRGILWACILVYAVYFLLSVNQPTDSLAILGGNPFSLVVRRLLMPPWIYLRGLGLFAVMSVRPTFLLGHAYSHGVWFYFPVVFVLKTPLPALALFLLAIPVGLLAARVAPRKTPAIPAERRIHWRATWVFLVVFTAFCMISQTTISIRHFTIPMALLTLAAAPLPRALATLRESGFRFTRPLAWLAATLAAASLVITARAYPYFFPFLNSLSLGRPGYVLVNDSNLDWNQALPDVRRFAEQRNLDRLLLDPYGFSDPVVYVPQAELWNCQMPAPSDGGRWAVVSASMILDGHNCAWLTGYPHEAFAGGSMYAFRLPPVIPAVGEPGGPPRPDAYRNLGGMTGEMDMVPIFLRCIRDPGQLKPTMDKMMADFAAQRGR
jgi:4-amino-4-deoxy-L-arabinose transferase-like glycosyltransferase